MEKYGKDKIMKKVLITGGTGFIGKWMIKELIKNNIEVIALVRKNSVSNLGNLKDRIKIVECSFKDYSNLPEKIQEKDIDTLFHFAWAGVSGAELRDEEIQINNLKTTLDLVDSAKKMGISTFIGAGSLHEIEGIVEMGQDKVISNLGYMYKAAKISAHWMAKVKAENYGMRFFWPIITNTYGEGENSGRLINTIIRKIYKGEEMAVSEGKQLYDFVYISDVVKAFYLIAEKGKAGANYTIGSGNPKPLKCFFKEIEEVANEVIGGTYTRLDIGKVKDNIVFLPEEVFDTTSLKRDTGFIPEISFKEGVEKTVKWIKKDM